MSNQKPKYHDCTKPVWITSGQSATICWGDETHHYEGEIWASEHKDWLRTLALLDLSQGDSLQGKVQKLLEQNRSQETPTQGLGREDPEWVRSQERLLQRYERLVEILMRTLEGRCNQGQTPTREELLKQG